MLYKPAMSPPRHDKKGQVRDYSFEGINPHGSGHRGLLTAILIIMVNQHFFMFQSILDGPVPSFETTTTACNVREDRGLTGLVT